jgi:SAM-dependent methyltransferase
MIPGTRSVQAHYDTFLADHYLWMAGGFDANAEKNRAFLSAREIAPRITGTAIDLGAGCGFMAIPLAEAGFRVTAVDFCRQLLDELRCQEPSSAIETVTGTIMDFPIWSGRRPELIACMGDTLTHLPDKASVSRLIRQCSAELVPGGRLVLSFRDYSRGDDGDVTVIPVRRDEGRIFLCRLEFRAEKVLVTDILYSRDSGTWQRSSGEYCKLRVNAAALIAGLEQAGFPIDEYSVAEGIITIIARRDR